MKITEIERTVSGDNYDNISLRVQLAEDENVDDIAKQVDLKAKQLLGLISMQEAEMRSAKREKTETISLLESALKFARDSEIPF